MSTNINQAEAKNSPTNFFYNSIKEKIQNSDVSKTLDKIIEKNYILNKNDYQFIGNIAYFFGIDFTSQQGSLNKNTIANFNLRIKDLNIDQEQLSKFQQIIENLDIENVVLVKDGLKDLITKECNFNGETLHKVKSNVNAIFRDSNFPVSIGVEIHDLMKTKKYTYANLLKINKSIYENINMAGSSFKHLRILFNLPEYSEEILKADNYYELQKFTILYFDQILSLQEWFANNTELAADYLTYFDGTKEFVEVVPKEAEKVIENIEIVPETVVTTDEIANNPDNTDLFFLGVVSESCNTLKFNDAVTYLEAIKGIIPQDDLMQYVYQYIKANKDKNRIDFNKFMSFEKDDFMTLLLNEIAAYNDTYKTMVEKYLGELPENSIQKVITYVNDLITSIIVDNSERKSYLFQQLNENQISTYKHLHQMIGLIEECNIKGDQLNAYINLRDFVENNLSITEIFDSIVDIDALQLKINFLQGIKEFYSVETCPNEGCYEANNNCEKCKTVEENPAEKTTE